MGTRAILRTAASLLTLSFIVSCDTPTHPDGAAPAPQHSRNPHLEYTLIEAPLPPGLPLNVSELIGPLGGSISLAGHKLTVPAGAVTDLTVFSLTLPTTGYVEVELTAVRIDALGNALDVGAAGFPKRAQPTLSLSYAAATNVDKPQKLAILYMPDGSHEGGHVALKSKVDRRAQTVTTTLEHFSGYCMAEGRTAPR